jgi:FlaG/FlaF family flagellin (archaellin)
MEVDRVKKGVSITLKKRSLWRNLKAVSPVISTIIIVAIAIVMSIAVAYWMLGIGGSFTRFEKLEFVSGYVSDANSDHFNITVTLKNTGSADATIDLVFLNAKPSSAYGTTVSNVTITYTGATTLKPGDSTSAVLTLSRGTGTVWKSGMSVEVMIQTVAGRQYPKTINLP